MQLTIKFTDAPAKHQQVQGNQKLLGDFGFSQHAGALIPFLLFSFLLFPLDEVCR